MNIREQVYLDAWGQREEPGGGVNADVFEELGFACFGGDDGDDGGGDVGEVGFEAGGERDFGFDGGELGGDGGGVAGLFSLMGG